MAERVLNERDGSRIKNYQTSRTKYLAEIQVVHKTKSNREIYFQFKLGYIDELIDQLMCWYIIIIIIILYIN